jgi:hypothetical protein
VVPVVAADVVVGFDVVGAGVVVGADVVVGAAAVDVVVVVGADPKLNGAPVVVEMVEVVEGAVDVEGAPVPKLKPVVVVLSGLLGVLS